MNIAFDPKTGVPKFTLEKKDLKDAQEIERTMGTKGWKILKDYLAVGRESIIESGKDGIRTRSKKELSSEKWAVLKGWDESNAIPDRIILRAQEFLKLQKEEEENAIPSTNEYE